LNTYLLLLNESRKHKKKSVKDILQLTTMGDPLIASAMGNSLMAASFDHCSNDGKKRKPYLL